MVNRQAGKTQLESIQVQDYESVSQGFYYLKLMLLLVILYVCLCGCYAFVTVGKT